MTILIITPLVAAAAFIAGLVRHRVATLGAIGAVALAVYLLGLHISVGAVLGITTGAMIGLSAAIAARVALAITHPALTALDEVRRRSGHTRIGLVVAAVRLLVAGRRLLLR
jgi:hypothetical protein